MVAPELALGSDSAPGISGDGRFIVGDTFSSTGNFDILWEANGAVHLIPDIPGGHGVGVAGDISDTGVVSGSSQSAMGPFGPVSQALRWTVDGGLVPMGFLNDTDSHSEACAISADGSVIAGRGASVSWMWTEQTGTVATAGTEFESRGMTEDGAFILGRQRISVKVAERRSTPRSGPRTRARSSLIDRAFAPVHRSQARSMRRREPRSS